MAEGGYDFDFDADDIHDETDDIDDIDWPMVSTDVDQRIITNQIALQIYGVN